jgi:hypothetical protein
MSAASPHPDDGLLALVYGELSTAEAKKVQAHLAGCAVCARTVEGYQAVRRAASVLPSEIPSAEGLDSLLHYGAEAAARARRGRRMRSVVSLVGAFAAVALVLFVAAPKRPTETAALPANTPPAVGPLAEADVKPLAKQQAAPFAEGLAAAKSVPGRPPASAAHADKAKSTEAVGRAREVAAASDAVEAASSAASRNAAAPAPAFAAAGARGATAGTQGVSAAGAGLMRSASAPVANAPAAPRMDVALAQPVSAVALASDAGEAAQRRADEARRSILLQQLGGAVGAQRRGLLSELCAVDVRLGRQADAQRVCAMLVEEYPGTQEAFLAQQALEHLPKP